MKRQITIEENELKCLEHYVHGINRIREKLQRVYNCKDMVDSPHSEALRDCTILAGQLSQALKNFVETGKISEINIDI